MTFDTTINLTAIVNLGVTLAFALIYLIRMEGKMNVFALRIRSLEESVFALIKTDVRLATIEERLTNHVSMLTTAQRDISDLRRGDGFIRASGRSSVDGEYQ
jgi:hypothetical protein